MATLRDLIDQTAEFFARHWNLREEQPRWSDPWHGIGPVPSHDRQGCYALFNGDDLRYIGVAIGHGSEKHQDFGLSYRIVSYLQKQESHIDEKAVFTFKVGLNYTGLRTIAFPAERAYLALALEHYLISQLSPAQNKRGVKSRRG